MIKLRKGNTRIALILFNLVVIKFPNPRFFEYKVYFCGKPKREVLKEFPRLAGDYARSLYTAFISGFAINVAEAMLFCFARNVPFLTPLFSFGLINLQFYQGEDQPTEEEMLAFIAALPKKAKKYLLCIDGHSLGRHNWRKTPKGLRIIDYGPNPLLAPLGLLIRSCAEIDDAT